MHVAVGILRNPLGEILIAQRPQGKYKAGLWEFPGGKVESMETVFHALQREFEEELGVTVETAEPWMQFQHDYTDRIVLLDVWNVIRFSGEPQGREGQSIQWVNHQALHQFEFLEGNRVILEKIHTNIL
jgi:8-oxo-dGTP diphosphatase